MFWKGFYKQASMRVGIKTLQPLSAAGKRVGNKPSTLVTTKAAVKPNPVPGVLQHSAENNLAPKL